LVDFVDVSDVVEIDDVADADIDVVRVADVLGIPEYVEPCMVKVPGHFSVPTSRSEGNPSGYSWSRRLRAASRTAPM
jgi:hypothetical protein